MDLNSELLQGELLLRAHQDVLSEATLMFIRGVLFKSPESTLKRRVGNFISLNPSLLDICSNLPKLPQPFMAFFKRCIIEKAELEEIFQSSLANCLRRSVQKSKGFEPRALERYISEMDVEHMGPDTRLSFICSLVQLTRCMVETSVDTYRVCLAALKDRKTADLLAEVFKEARLMENTNFNIASNLGKSFDSFAVAALYEALDNKVCFIEKILESGTRHLRRKEYDQVRRIFGDTCLRRLKPILLAMIWDKIDNHDDQAVALSELCYSTGPNERLARAIFVGIKDQVDVGKWCEVQVKPLLKDDWDACAAATITSSRSKLQIILALHCIEKLGQEKVLCLMFNVKEKENVDVNNLPLSDALTLDQGRDIVTFCSAMVVINVISWLQSKSKGDEDTQDELTLAQNHLSRVFPLSNRAVVLGTSFSALVHTMKNPRCGMTLNDCTHMVDWLEKQLEQLSEDQASLSLGHFDTVKIFKDLSSNQDPGKYDTSFEEVNEAVREVKWRISLLRTLTETKSRKRKELSNLISSNLISFLCANPQDLLRLCLIFANTEKAEETLQRYEMRTSHLAKVVEFQSDYARCTKELERFGLSLRKHQQQQGKPTGFLASGEPSGGRSGSSRGRTPSTSSTGSVNSTISTISRAPTLANVPACLRNVATAAAKSAEKSKVPAIVSKLTSTLTSDQLMVECEMLDVDKEILIARLLWDMGCSISAPKSVGLQLISLALDRLQDNIAPDSSIESYAKKLHAIMLMLDAKPYPGISVATVSPREYLNSIYSCISHEVLQGLLDFNENQAVSYRDLLNAVNDKGPVDVVRMQGTLEAARDCLNLNNYTTFLSTHDKHRDYLGCLISYLNDYCSTFNIKLADTPQEVKFSPSKIFSDSPQHQLGELILKDGVSPKVLTEAADYLSVDLLQLIIMSSFPQICIEGKSQLTLEPVHSEICPLLEEDDSKVLAILGVLQTTCAALPDVRKLPLHNLLLHLENSEVSFEGERFRAIDLIRLLTGTISPYKAISRLQPEKFRAAHLLGLLMMNCPQEYNNSSLECKLRERGRNWQGNHSYISPEGELQLALHPLLTVAITILKRKGGQSKEHLTAFYKLYIDIVLEFLGDEIAGTLSCSKVDLNVVEHDDSVILESTKSRMNVDIRTAFDYKYTTVCTKCKDVEEDLLFREELKPKTQGYAFVKGFSDCLATLGYMFTALDSKELYGACVIIDDTLLKYPALHQYVSLTAANYIHTIDGDFVDLMRAKHSTSLDMDVIGCHLFGGGNTSFLRHMLNCMVEFNLHQRRFSLVYDVLNSDKSTEIFGKKIPDLVLLLSLDRRSATARDFFGQFLKMQDKHLGLEYVVEHFEDSLWPVDIATECFMYFSEVLGETKVCAEVISGSLERLRTISRISKILKCLGSELNLNTCTKIEQFVRRKSEEFSALMAFHKEFSVGHSAVKLGILSKEYEARLLAEHVVFMAQNDNFDTLDIYNILEGKETAEVCESLCSAIKEHTNNLKIVLQLIDIILDKFQPQLTPDRRSSLMKQRLGALCFREIRQLRVPSYEGYSELLFRPLFLIEMLIMNLQIHTAAGLVRKYKVDFEKCELTSSLDGLIKLYIVKALYYEGTKKSDSNASTAYSTISRLSSVSKRSKKPLTSFDPPFRGSTSKMKKDQYPIPSSPAPWVDDSKTKRCQICRTRFTFIIRKHHCRWCGRVLCDKCGPVRSPTSYFGAAVRLCRACHTAIQEGRFSSEGGGEEDLTEDLNTLYNPPFEQLSTEVILNTEMRDNYQFSGAPSAEVSLHLCHMLWEPAAEILLPLCEGLSDTVMESVRADASRDYTQLFSVLETVLKDTRNRYRQRGISGKVEQVNVYIAYSQICRRLPISDLAGMPPLRSLLKTDVLHSTYMGLLEKQHAQMAISLCTTARKDPLGLWRRWGFQALKAGDYPSARDKLEMCLKNKQYNQAILDEIIHHLEHCVPSFLSETTDIDEFVSEIRRKCKKQKLNPAEFEECVYYLSNYSSPVRLTQFFVRHRAIARAAQVAMKHEFDILHEGILQPLIKTGLLSAILEYINSNRGQFEAWKLKLTACCKLLSESGDLQSVFTVQFFLKEYLAAARTSILMLRSELSVAEQLKFLSRAEDCIKAFLEDSEPGLQSNVAEVNTRLSHIHLQRQILEFLKVKQIKDNNSNIHIFSSKTDKKAIVLELYRIDSVESLPIIRSIREVFSLTHMEVYQPLVNLLLNSTSSGNISTWFPRLLKILGELPPAHTDQLLLSVCGDLRDDQKSFERLLAIMKDDRSKIRANVNAGFLKNAYILAVNRKLREEIVLLEEECGKQGDTQVRQFCIKYLQHNPPK